MLEILPGVGSAPASDILPPSGHLWSGGRPATIPLAADDSRETGNLSFLVVNLSERVVIRPNNPFSHFNSPQPTGSRPPRRCLTFQWHYNERDRPEDAYAGMPTMSVRFESLFPWKLVPVVALDRAADAEPLAEALEAAGLPCAEITLRTAAALEAIRRLAGRDRFLVGAGTVHNVDQVEAVVEAGAAFVVAPGLNPKVVQSCRRRGVPVLPGIATPTDLELAMELGLSYVKFFPAEPLGGVRMLRALAGPYHQMRFVPTGGIRLDNLLDYLRLDVVPACGGSWMVARAWIAAGEFDRVTEETKRALQEIARLDE